MARPRSPVTARSTPTLRSALSLPSTTCWSVAAEVAGLAPVAVAVGPEVFSPALLRSSPERRVWSWGPAALEASLHPAPRGRTPALVSRCSPAVVAAAGTMATASMAVPAEGLAHSRQVLHRVGSRLVLGLATTVVHSPSTTTPPAAAVEGPGQRVAQSRMAQVPVGTVALDCSQTSPARASGMPAAVAVPEIPLLVLAALAAAGLATGLSGCPTPAVAAAGMALQAAMTALAALALRSSATSAARLPPAARSPPAPARPRAIRSTPSPRLARLTLSCQTSTQFWRRRSPAISMVPGASRFQGPAR